MTVDGVDLGYRFPVTLSHPVPPQYRTLYQEATADDEADFEEDPETEADNA